MAGAFLMAALDLGWLTVFGIALMVLGIGQILLASAKEDGKIRTLGDRAPRVRRRWIPYGLDVLWSSVQYAVRYQDLAWWSDMFSTWGRPERPWTVETRLLGTRIIYTADRENIEAILANQFDDFEKGKALNQRYHDFLGNNFMTTDGDEWWGYRKLMRPLFMKHRLSDLEILESRAQILLPLLSASLVVDATDLFMRLSLDTFTASFLGHGVESLRAPDQDVAVAFQEVQRVQSLLNLAGPFRIFIPKQSFYASIKLLNGFIQPIVDRTMTLAKRGPHEETQHEGFLSSLSSFSSDRTVVRDQIMSLLVGGRDSTSNTMSWMFYHLGIQPILVARLRDEILANVGQRCPTYEELKSMSLLQHTIDETLRLYPPVTANMRQAARDTTLPRGGGPDGQSPIGILKNTPVAFSTLCLHRKANQWPATLADFPDWSEFAPDRWAIWTPDRSAYVPFSLGRRGCIGRDFAMTHMAYVTVRILQTYSSIDCRMEERPNLDCSLVLRPSRSIRLSFCR